ncbi:hypothetical protein [Ktedonobacter racemifer]|uniref:ABM domain-containing protein n=1 Tax=Ktedonobacter racemifer DSM 44963 TaxID=485913 RepID=D6U2Q2_KTERA|nr:hypothetical protein [Ktedonobacter racemifer]EFH81016.1 hypothetical protein Krac_1676 [Ktedonobacter racemifer DSM 44963]
MTIAHAMYTVKAEYATQNKKHVSQVIEELQALHRDDIQYSVFVQEDGKTFTHLLICANEEAGRAFTGLKAFAAFQAALTESQPEVSPSVNNVTLVGSTSDLLSR